MGTTMDPSTSLRRSEEQPDRLDSSLLRIGWVRCARDRRQRGGHRRPRRLARGRHRGRADLRRSPGVVEPRAPALHRGGAAVACRVRRARAVLRRTPAAGSGQLALASAVVGTDVHVVFFSLDGYALKRTADAWAAADGAQQADLLQAGQLVLLLQNSQFVSAITLMLGLPIALFGLAVARSQIHPAWLGWIAVLAGVGAMVSGMTRFVGLDELVPDPVLFPAFALPASLWIAALGVSLWRSATRA